MALQPTGKEIQKQDPLALRVPPGNFNVHLVNVVLAGQRFSLSLFNLSRLPPPQDLIPLLSDVPPTLLQSLLCLPLYHPRLHKRNNVPQPRVHGPHCQDGELEQEHDHHRGLRLCNHRVDRVAQEPAVVDDAREKRHHKSGVEEPGVRGGLLLKDFDATLTNPAPDLARDEGGEHDEEEGSDFLAEDGHGEAGLGDGEPCLFVELFDFDGAEGTEAEALEAVHEGAIDEEGEVDNCLVGCTCQLAVSQLRVGAGPSRMYAAGIGVVLTIKQRLLWDR